MIAVRDYRRDDSVTVGTLIAETYSEFNLGFASPDQRADLMGPFVHHTSGKSEHQSAVADAIEAPIVLVAEHAGRVAGVLRGGRVDRRGRTILQSVFVSGRDQRSGLGSRLVGEFENRCRSRGVAEIAVASTLEAVAFYLALGYSRTTGVRAMRTFEGGGLPYQPMKKCLAANPSRSG